MVTIEDVLKETFTIFEKQAKEALEAALSKAYEEYLPHVENDTYYNVRQQARAWVLDFMAGTLTDTDLLYHVTTPHGYSAGQVRKKMYEDNKEEIQKVIGADLQNQIDRLKSELQAAYRSY